MAKSFSPADVQHMRQALTQRIYLDNLNDEEAPSLAAVREACHADAAATVRLWSDVDVIRAYRYC